MLMASLIWSLCWVFIISLNKYLVPQIKRTLRYLFISIINGARFVGCSVGLWDGRMRGYWFSVCGFYLVYKWDALDFLAFRLFPWLVRAPCLPKLMPSPSLLRLSGNMNVRSALCGPGSGSGSLTLAPTTRCQGRVATSLQLPYWGQRSKEGSKSPGIWSGLEHFSPLVRPPPYGYLFFLRDMSNLTLTQRGNRSWNHSSQSWQRLGGGYMFSS